MKVLVISDTHGNLSRFYEVYKELSDIDMVFHLGDMEDDAISIAKRIDVPVKYVKGNCDGAMVREEANLVVDTDFGKVLLTHGHLEGVHFDPTRLFYRAEELGVKAVFCGHTHVPMNVKSEGIYLLNPGSIAQPRDGSNGSYGIANISEEGIDFEIRYYEKPKAKPEGGYIRGLINYSDRF